MYANISRVSLFRSLSILQTASPFACMDAYENEHDIPIPFQIFFVDPMNVHVC